MNLIIQPMHDWRKIESNGYATRDAHFIEHFEKNSNVQRILVINRPLSISEMVIYKKSFPIKTGVTVSSGFGWVLKQLSDKLFVLDSVSYDLFSPLFYKRNWWQLSFDSTRIQNVILNSINFIFNKMPIYLFLCNPMAIHLYQIIKPTKLIFDALDNWLVHPEMDDNFGFIKQGYDFLLKKADLFYVNSNQSFDYFSKFRSDIKLILNGVDSSFFKLRENRIIPDDLQPLKNKPVVGYAGKLAKRIDVNLLLLLAKTFPNINFVVIGEILDRNWISRLMPITNIFYLGSKKYSIYPRYLNGFDICIIPHNVGPLECGGDPIKLYEYLSCDKPVISTNIAEVDQFKDNICIAHSHQEFVEHLYSLLALKKPLSHDCVKKEHEWYYKTNEIINDILSLQTPSSLLSKSL